MILGDEVEVDYTFDDQVEFEKLIMETKEKQSDIFGFGEYVRGNLRNYWDSEIKSPEKWREIYKDLSIDVKAKVKIEGVGLKTR